MLMANSVEGRFPFLDHRLVEYASALPMSLKLFALDEKHLLKLASRAFVPADILSRPKQPYRAPDAASFFGAHRPEWIDDLFSPSRVAEAGIFRPQSVAKLAEKCRMVDGVGMSNSDNMRLVGVVSMLMLQRQFIDGEGLRDSPHPGPATIVDRA